MAVHNNLKKEEMYKIIIAGSREFSDYELLKTTCDNFLNENNLNKTDIQIISGHARGADKLGEQYARERKHYCYIMPADWNKHGKRAGYLRNADMAQEANALIAFWDGQSRGTAHMLDIAKQANLNVKVILYKELL